MKVTDTFVFFLLRKEQAAEPHSERQKLKSYSRLILGRPNTVFPREKKSVILSVFRL
jgi:hypothetical protein